MSESKKVPPPGLRAFHPRQNPSREGKLVGDFSTTTKCNAYCIGCYTNAARLAHAERQRLGREFLTEAQWLALLDELEPHIRTLVISGLGDLTFDRWPMNQRIIDRALEHGLQVCVFTNGICVDKEMVDWFACRKDVSIIGKWLHVDRRENERLLGLQSGSSGSYVQQDDMSIPGHLIDFLERGLADDYRIAFACTMLRSNSEVAPVMWRWGRDTGVIPIFSWLVPTPGMGTTAKVELGEDLETPEREQLTRVCWSIDQQVGYHWDFCMGPRVGSSSCGDEYLVYFGPFGDTRLCPSSHEDPLAYWPDRSVETLIAGKLGLEKQITGLRSDVEGCASCICAARCGDQQVVSLSLPVVTSTPDKE